MKRYLVCAATALLVAASGLLHWVVDSNLGVDWANTAVRNWQQFGFWTLGGKLVMNAGGFEALTRPEVYRGHKPGSLYPVFAVTKLFEWTGADTLSFHLVLAIAVFVSVWLLLGKDLRAYLVAGAVILCPGYVRWQMTLDPNAVVTLMGIPYVALVMAVLRQGKLSAGALLGLFALILAYTMMNWTAVMVHGVVISFFFASAQRNWRRLLLYVSFAAMASVLIVSWSVLEKMGCSGVDGRQRSVSEFLGGYMWGTGGYGAWATGVRSLTRLSFVNLVGLMPLWALAGWAAVSPRWWHGTRRWLAGLPAFVAILEVAVMRNYFGQHPWMAAPILLLGIILSGCVLRPTQERVAIERQGVTRTGVLLAGCFCYGLAVLLVFRANQEEMLALASFVRSHVPRSEAVAILRPVDPDSAAKALRLQAMLDRHVVVLDRLDDGRDTTAPRFVLSAVALPHPWRPLATSSSTAITTSAPLKGIIGWFNRTISQRSPGDRMDIPSSYFLYDMRGGRP